MLKQLLFKRINKELTIYDRFIKQPRSSILTILLNPLLTTFDINDFIKQSKKSRRSEKLRIIEKPVLQYQITGKCLRLHSRLLSTTFLIRNIISLTSFEMNFSLFSPLISLYLIHEPKKRRFKRATQYFLRQHAPVKSKINFSYVLE